MNNLLTTVPSLTSSMVVDFCHAVASGESPQYVDVISETYSRENVCFQNVTQKVKNDGGSIVYGWQIRLMPELLIEAEFHAV